MANTRSAKKRVRASVRKRDRNRSTRSAAKTLVARARRPSGTGAPSLTGDEVRRAISALDKAAEKGIIHRNNASRRKGRLMSALAKLTAEKPRPAKTSVKAAAPASSGAKTAAGSGAKKPAPRPAKAKA